MFARSTIVAGRDDDCNFIDPMCLLTTRRCKIVEFCSVFLQFSFPAGHYMYVCYGKRCHRNHNFACVCILVSFVDMMIDGRAYIDIELKPANNFA